MIKSGVKIGDGAIIGMRSIVTKDVEPYSIVAGNPAKFIRKRFDDKTISILIDSQWWNWSNGKLIEMGKYFNNVTSFIDKI